MSFVRNEGNLGKQIKFVPKGCEDQKLWIRNLEELRPQQSKIGMPEHLEIHSSQWMITSKTPSQTSNDVC